MTTRILIKAGNFALDAELNESETAAAVAARLPVSVIMTRWGEEYYGDMGEPLGAGESHDAREEMAVGEIAYWPPGNALCIFFGPTPASTSDEPRAASPVNPIGRIDGDATALKALGGQAVVVFEAAES
jgi:hypothetical protein